MNNTQFMGFINDGKIFQSNYGQQQEIGVTLQAHKELENSLNAYLEEALNKAEHIAKERDDYKKMLVEHGLIEQEKTPEDMHNEMISFMKEIKNNFKKLNDEFLNIKTEVSNLKSNLGG